MNRYVYDSTGNLIERWNATTRTYTRWDIARAIVEQRPFTPAENARADEAAAAEAVEANQRTIEQAAADALAQNRTIVTGADTYLAGHISLPASPTTAQVNAAVKAYGAQVRALTVAAQWAARQRNGLIRLALNELDGTD